MLLVYKHAIIYLWLVSPTTSDIQIIKILGMKTFLRENTNYIELFTGKSLLTVKCMARATMEDYYDTSQYSIVFTCVQVIRVCGKEKY